MNDVKTYLHTPEKLVYSRDGVKVTFQNDGKCILRRGTETVRKNADPDKIIGMFREVEQILQEADDQICSAEVFEKVTIALYYPHHTVQIDASLACEGMPITEPILRLQTEIFV